MREILMRLNVIIEMMEHLARRPSNTPSTLSPYLLGYYDALADQAEHLLPRLRSIAGDLERHMIDDRLADIRRRV